MVFAAMTTATLSSVPIRVLIFDNRHQTATEAFDATSDGAGPTSDPNRRTTTLAERHTKRIPTDRRGHI